VGGELRGVYRTTTRSYPRFPRAKPPTRDASAIRPERRDVSTQVSETHIDGILKAMTFYEPNPDIRPTGEEAGEFIEPDGTADEEEGKEEGRDRTPPDPSARPSGSPPVEP
jgi:hypothetical protein